MKIEPFVERLNKARNSGFRYECCPDEEDSSRSTPDAQYLDPNSGAIMVVEHKSLLPRPDYAVRHENDHRLMDLLTTRISPEVQEENLTLELPYLLYATGAEIELLASGIADGINESTPSVTAGQTIGATIGDVTWKLRPAKAHERKPGHGICFSLSGSPKSPKRNFWAEVDRLLAACQGKFVHYTTAERIVLLEVVEESCLPVMEENLPEPRVPEAIDEVWFALYEHFDDGQEAWLYRQYWPDCGQDFFSGL